MVTVRMEKLVIRGGNSSTHLIRRCPGVDRILKRIGLARSVPVVQTADWLNSYPAVRIE